MMSLSTCGTVCALLEKSMRDGGIGAACAQASCRKPWAGGSTGAWWTTRVGPQASWACGPPAQ